MSITISNTKSLLVAGTLALSSLFLLSGSALASHNSTDKYRANLTPLNNSGSFGDAKVKVKGNQVTVKVKTFGASPNLPHAQHLHIGGNRNVCPTLAADTNNDGFISSVEGVPSYGDVRVSLTTSGDVSASSALTVPRFPVADANGMVNYKRTFTLPAGVSAADIEKAVLVQHGISELFEDPAKYDGLGLKASSLDSSLPFEATVPSACGKLMAMPGNGNNNGNNVNNGGNGNAPANAQASISNTGPGSNNSITVRKNSTTRVSNNNDVSVSNTTSQSATSGNAVVRGNTFAGNAFSGSAGNSSSSSSFIEVINN